MMNSLSYTDPAVVYYIDGVPSSSPILTHFDAQAIDTVRIWEGPQSGFWGQNAPMGVIEIESDAPKPYFSTKLSAEYGTYAHRSLFGEFTEAVGGKGSNVSILASGHHTAQDGFLTNPLLNTHPDFSAESGGRLALRWTPSKEWTIDLNGTQDYDNNGPHRFTPLSSPHDLAPNKIDGHSNLQNGLQSLRSRYEGDEIRVVFVSSHRSADLDPDLLDTGFGGASTITTARTHEQQYTQELRLSSQDPDGTAPLAWLAGAETQHVDFAATGKINQTSTNATSNSLIRADYDSYATFGAVTVRPGGMDNKLSLILSNRFQGDDKGADRSDNTYVGTALYSASTQRDRRMWLNFAPKAEADYKVRDDTTLFTSSGLAFRPGGYAPYLAQASLKPYASEQTWANEIGARYEDKERRFTAKTTLFWNETQNYQLQRNDYPNSDVVNAPEVASRGAEIDLSVRPAEGLTLHGSAGYTLSTFVRYRDSDTGIDAAGLNVPYVPRATFLLEGTYRHASGWLAHADLRGLGNTDYSAYNEARYRQDAYGLVGAKLGYEARHWSAYVYGENLANAQYSTLIDSGLNGQVSGAPRTYGVATDFAW